MYGVLQLAIQILMHIKVENRDIPLIPRSFSSALSHSVFFLPVSLLVVTGQLLDVQEGEICRHVQHSYSGRVQEDSGK